MAKEQIFRMQSLARDRNGRYSKITASAKHNFREISGSYDKERSKNNKHLEGPDKVRDVNERFQEIIRGVDVRKNAAIAIECIFSLPSDFWNKEDDCNRFFSQCLAWVKNVGLGVVLIADVHNDENNPHMHVILVPLINNKLQGSEAMGDRGRLVELQNNLHERVGKYFGLKRVFDTSGKIQQKKEKTRQVLEKLNDASDPALSSAVWSVIAKCINNDPDKFLAALERSSHPH